MNVLSGVFIALFLGGCSSCSAEEISSCSQLVKTYFSQPTKQQIAEFTSHDFETQYRIYRCGNQYIHPPTLYLAPPFASQGEDAAHFLKEKLHHPLSDLDLRDLLQVFAYMHRQQTYDVSNDEDLMNTLRNRVERMKDEDWRQYARDLLLEISGKESRDQSAPQEIVG